MSFSTSDTYTNSYSKSTRLFRRGAAVAALATLISVPTLKAATGVWGTEGMGGWSTATNWTDGIIPNGIDDVANFTFDLNIPSTISLDGTRTVGSMTVGDSVTPFNTYTFTANGQGGRLIFDTSAGNANLTISGVSTAVTTFNVPLQLNDTLNIHALNSVQNVFNGNISGTGGLIVDSSGTHDSATQSSIGQLQLTGINTFSGGLNITGVRVNAATASALGTGAVTVNDGGQIYISGGGVVTNSFTLNGFGWNESTHGQLGAIRSDGNATFTGAITLAGNSRLGGTGNTSLVNSVIGETGGSRDLQINRLLSGGAAANSTWVFNNTNTYTGKTTVYSGTLRIGDSGTSGSLGATSGLEFANANIEFRRSDNVTVTTPFTQLTGTIDGAAVTGSNFIHSGTGVLTLDNGASAYIGATTVNGTNGKLVVGTGGAYTFSGLGTTTLSNGADIEFNTSSNVSLGTVTLVAADAGNSFVIQSGSGTTTLGGAADNAFAGAIVNGGTLVLGKTSSASVHAIGSNANLNLIVNNGTLQLGGSGGDQIHTNTDVQVNGGTFDLNGTNEGFDVLTGNGGVVTNSKTASTSTLTLGENNSSVNLSVGAIAYNSTYGGVIKDGAGAAVVALTKAGTGLQTLSGANTYSGLTTINGGVLSVTGSTLSTGNLTVNTGGTLSGTGSVGNVVLIGTGTIRPGATNLDTVTGTLTLNGLTVFGGDIRMNLGVSNDRVNVTGTAAFNGASTLSPTFSTLPTAGTTTLINATGGLTAATLPTLAGVPATTRSTFALSTTANTLDLVVSGASAKSLTWTGAGTSAWDLNTTSNFDAGGVEKFFNLDAVTFGDGPVNRTITLAAGLTPTSVTVNNSTGNDYTFQTGSIAGGGTSLTKSGSGTLFLNTANTFSGPVTITGGTIKAGNATALGDANGQTFVSGGGTLDINGLNLGAEVINISGAGAGGLGALVNNSATAATLNRTVTLTGNATIGGTGRFDFSGVGSGVVDLAGFTLTKVGTNLVYLTNSSGVSQMVTNGNIDVQGGILGFAFTGTAVNGTGTITYNPGTTGYFYQTTAANITRDIVVNGANFQTQAQTSAVGSNIRLTGNLTVDDTGGSLTLAGNISESGGARSLIKANGGTLTLNGNNTFTGGITSTGGTINIGGTNTGSGPVNLTNSTLNVNGTPTVNASLGNASSISLSSSTLTLNLAGNYTLPATTLSNTNSSTINFAGQTQGTTLTINSPLGTTSNFNTLAIQKGTATLANGANVTVSQLNVGTTAPATGNVGTLNIQPGATVTTRNFYIGEGGGNIGIVNQTGGTVNVLGTDGTNDGSFRIGHWNGSGSTYNLSGGTLNVPNTTTSIGVDGVNPSFNISGGTANLYRLLVDGRGPTTAIGGTLNLSGGELVIGAGGLGNQGNGQVNISGGTLAASASSTWSAGMNFANNTSTFDTRGNNVIMSGGLYGSGGFTKVGGGRLTLSNTANLIDGTINANGGEIFVSGLLNSTAATVNVNSGGTLVLDATGFGAGINGKVNINSGGVLSSQGIGSGTVGSLTMNGGAARFELSPTDAGIGVNDLVAVTGALSFGSGATIIPSFTGLQTGGKVYTLFTSGTRTGLPVVDANAAVSRLTYAVGSSANGVTLSVTGAAKALTWTGANGSTWDLNTTANFSAPGSEKFFQQDAVTFAGAAPGTITLAGVLQPSTVTVNSTADYTLAGPGSIDTGSLTKSGTGSLTLTGVNNYASGTAINGGTLAFANGSLGSSSAITMNGGTLKWHGTNTEDVSARIAMVEGVDAKFDTNGNTVTFANPIGSFTGAGLNKAGAGTLVLNGVNNYTGATTVSGGTLSVGNGISAASIDSISPVSIASGATMKWNNAPNGTIVTIANQISGAGDLVLQGLNATNALQTSLYDLIGDNTGLTGKLQINRAILTNIASPTELGSATIELQDRGTMYITTDGTYANNIIVGQGAGWHHNVSSSDVVLGAIRLQGTNTLSGNIVLNNTASVVLGDNTGANSTIGAYTTSDNLLTGVISGPGDFAMSRYTSYNGGTVQDANIRLGGSASNSYTGKTVVDGQGNKASLYLEKTGGAVAIAGNTVVQMGSGTNGMANLRMGQSEQFGPGVVMNFVNANGQWMRFDLRGTTQTLAGINAGTSASTTQAGAVIQNREIGNTTSNYGTSTLTLNGSANSYYYGYIRDSDNGASATNQMSIVKSGTGTQTFAGNQILYTGTTTVSGGTLRLENTTAFASSIDNSATVEVSAPAGTNYTLGTTKFWSGNGTWIKTGDGRVRLSNTTVSATGSILVQAGMLGNDGNAADWSSSSANLSISNGATFDGRADSVRLNSLNGAGTFTNSYGNGGGVFDTLTVGVADGSGVFSGPINDGGAARPGNGAASAGGEGRGGIAFTKEGGGKQTLAGNNTYAGVTTINGGTLQIGNGGTTGTLGTNNVFNNGALVFDRSNKSTVNNTISGAGSFTKQGAGTLVLNSANSYSGPTVISGGTLQLGADSTLPVSAGIWLDATDASSLNTSGGLVSSWVNKGTMGSIGDAVATATQKPTLVNTEPAMNNQPVIHFDAAADGKTTLGRLTNSLDFTGNNVTIMYAGRLTGGANYRLVSGVNNNWLLGTFANTSDRAHMIQSNGFADQGGVAANTNAHIYTASINAGVSAAFYADTILRGAPTGAFTGPNGLSLGGGYANNTEFSDGDIGEVLVFNSVLSEDDRRAVEAYLTRKWKGIGSTNVLPTSTALSLTNSGATLNVNGVTQIVGSISGVVGSNIALGGGNLTTGGDETSTSFDGALSGAGTIHKVGSGAWTLGGANTNTGDVFVDAGTVIVSGSLSGSTVTVASGATLGGAGTITGDVLAQIGAKIAPGTGVGQLDTGNFRLNTGATLSLGLGGTTAGTQYDQLNVTGSVTLGGTLSLSLSNGFTPQLGQKFWITLNDTEADAVSGVFANAPITNIANSSGSFTSDGYVWSVYYGANAGTGSITGGNDIMVMIPEPNSMITALGGLGVLVGMRRRRTAR